MRGHFRQKNQWEPHLSSSALYFTNRLFATSCRLFFLHSSQVKFSSQWPVQIDKYHQWRRLKSNAPSRRCQNTRSLLVVHAHYFWNVIIYLHHRETLLQTKGNSNSQRGTIEAFSEVWMKGSLLEEIPEISLFSTFTQAKERRVLCRWCYPCATGKHLPLFCPQHNTNFRWANFELVDTSLPTQAIMLYYRHNMSGKQEKSCMKQPEYTLRTSFLLAKPLNDTAWFITTLDRKQRMLYFVMWLICYAVQMLCSNFPMLWNLKNMWPFSCVMLPRHLWRMLPFMTELHLQGRG